MTFIRDALPISQQAGAVLFWLFMSISIGLLVWLVVIWWRKSGVAPMSKDDDTEMCDYNTFFGNVRPPKRMGHGNTIVGPTDAAGNTTINGTTSVGYRAGHAPGSVIIGAFAGQNLGKKRPDEKTSV